MESANSSLLVFLVVVWLSVAVQVDAQSRVDEVQALISFGAALDSDLRRSGGYTSTYASTWNKNDENACAWIGVTCTENFTVVALDLSGWGLTGYDNLGALSNLPDLLQLDMSSNYIFESITDDIGNLSQLTMLDMSRNMLVGNIPPGLSACRSLRYLSLEQNNLEGPIPDLSNMVHLQFLQLAENNLTGSFPRELGKINSLVFIDMSGNQLNGSIPSLLNSTNLLHLNLNNNLFDGFDDSLDLNAPNLQELDVSDNQLEGIIPLALTNMRNLWALNMSCNRLSGKIPSGFSFETGLVSVDLSYNNLSGSIPVDLLQAPAYAEVSLNVSHNYLNDSIPTPVVTNSSFFELDLSHNQLRGSIPSTLFGSQTLHLDHNFLSGDVVDILVDCQTFAIGPETLLLGNNLLTGDLSRMTYKWASCPTLSVLDLSNNNLSWTTSKSIPDPITAALNNFPMYLLEFHVGGNDFSGTFLPVGPQSPPSLGPPKLQILDLSSNHLQGMISGHVFNSTTLPSLILLNLSNNEATGPVPESLIAMLSVPKRVITMYSWKWLPYLGYFPYLGSFEVPVLDVSNNKLTGPLPIILVNSSLSTNPSGFAGNPGLCGYPLRECPQPGTRAQIWILLTIIGGLVVIAMGSCLVAAWQWRIYHERHAQDEDLIKTLMEKDSATLMSLRDLKRATNNFSDSVRIGEGGFGTVYMGELDNGSNVAIKRSKREGSEADKRQFLNEVRILSQVNHRHLVKLLGCCMENKVSLLVFEFVSNGTLQEHLHGKTGHHIGLSWKQRLNIAVQTADALSYLHFGTNFPIYHRDVKSANILLNDDLTTKVADFGISKLAPMEATHVSTAGMGTIGYIDSEYYTYHRLTDRSDVYSFGVVLLELISAKPAVFQIDGEPVNLVIFATPHIENGDMQPLIDPILLETYNDTSGHEKESILSVGRLAIKCLAMPSKERPNMNEVWKELQDLCLKLNGTSMDIDLESVNADDNIEDPWSDDRVLLPQIFSNHTHSLEMQNGPRSRDLYYVAKQDLDQ